VSCGIKVCLDVTSGLVLSSIVFLAGSSVTPKGQSFVKYFWLFGFSELTHVCLRYLH
jgi:hypothetical protein